MTPIRSSVSRFLVLNLSCVIACVTLPTDASADAPRQDPILLWPDDPELNSPDKLGEAAERDGKTRVSNIGTPHLIPYLVEEAVEATPAVILCPGGGYRRLVPSLHWPIAEWLNERGISAFVLMYRCPTDRLKGEALPDLQRAIRLVRSRADEWNIDPQRLGILGTSAGGNLCARASLGFGEASYEAVDDADTQNLRPDFVVLMYPAWLAHRVTKEPAPWVVVPENMPPTLIVTARDDTKHFPNSPIYEAVLKQAGASVKAIYFGEGGHGFGMGAPGDAASWPGQMVEWFEGLEVVR